MSEFCFRSISWEQIDGTWLNFAYALILTRSRFGLLRVHFPKFITELWPFIDVRISFPLNILRRIDGIRPNFAYALILIRSRFGLLSVNFHELITELWPLIDVRISFPVNILRTNWLFYASQSFGYLCIIACYISVLSVREVQAVYILVKFIKWYQCNQLFSITVIKPGLKVLVSLGK